MIRGREVVEDQGGVTVRCLLHVRGSRSTTFDGRVEENGIHLSAVCGHQEWLALEGGGYV